MLAPIDRAAYRLVLREQPRHRPAHRPQPAGPARRRAGAVAHQHPVPLDRPALRHGARPEHDPGRCSRARSATPRWPASPTSSPTPRSRASAPASLAMLSARAGQGAGNALLHARLGIEAIRQCRPLPFMAEEPPRLASVRQGAVRERCQAPGLSPAPLARQSSPVAAAFRHSRLGRRPGGILGRITALNRRMRPSLHALLGDANRSECDEELAAERRHGGADRAPGHGAVHRRCRRAARGGARQVSGVLPLGQGDLDRGRSADRRPGGRGLPPTGRARIDVTGHTDTSGSAAYNLELSQRRAEAVAGELVRQGVPADGHRDRRPGRGGPAGADRGRGARGRATAGSRS